MEAEVVKRLPELRLVGFAGPPAKPPEHEVIGKKQLLCVRQHLWAQQRQIAFQGFGSDLDDVLVELHSQDALLVRLLEDTAAKQGDK